MYGPNGHCFYLGNWTQRCVVSMTQSLHKKFHENSQRPGPLAVLKCSWCRVDVDQR